MHRKKDPTRTEAPLLIRDLIHSIPGKRDGHKMLIIKATAGDPTQPVKQPISLMAVSGLRSEPSGIRLS